MPEVLPTIPFTVIGGFLGAGKTTLLQQLLAQAHSQRLAVLVNDFGAIQIDPGLGAQHSAIAGGYTDADIVTLANGCVCCSIGSDLTAALDRLLRAQPPFDAIVVEASGVSDPWRIAQIALADPLLALAAVVVLVDAESWAQQLADPLLADTLLRQLIHADLVLLNKADRASTAQLAAARARVAQQVGAVPLLQTTDAVLPPGLLLALVGQIPGEHASAGLPPSPPTVHQPKGDGQLQAGGVRPGLAPPPHGQQFDHAALKPSGLFDLPRLRRWLAHLPPGVLRLKAQLPLSAPSAPAGGASPPWASLQWAGHHGTLRRLPSAPAGGAALVAIALAGQLPLAALNDGLLACLAQP